jgi:hypothetical protein
MPDLAAPGPLSPETNLWLGRICAAVEATGSLSDSFNLDQQVRNLHSAGRPNAAQRIYTIIYRALARAELQAPAGMSGTFIPVGNSFDAFAALSKILKDAKKDVLIVDPYMDETALTEFGVAVPENVLLRLLTDTANHKPTLAPAANKWVNQYGTARPLAVRLAPPKSLHDRAIFVDGAGAWTLTQSLKDLAKRAPAEIVRVDDIATLKIPAYEAIWKTAAVVV